jgi:hypothetical protein
MRLFYILTIKFCSCNLFDKIAKDGTKAIHLSYDDRNLLFVLNKQIKNFKYEEEKNKVGFLDLVGNDRL